MPKMAGIIAQNDAFYSAVSRDPIPDQNFRAFTFHFRPDVLSEEEMVCRSCEVLGVSRNQLLDYRLKRNRLPMLRLGHRDRIQRIDELTRNEMLAITGNWFDGVSIEDALLRTVAEVERLFPA